MKILSETRECLQWLSEIRKTNIMEVIQTPIDSVEGWYFSNSGDQLQHEKGNFFSVRGFRVEEANGLITDQPIIYQPEVGILGLLVKISRKNIAILVQAKAEPGNTNITQFAPTYQATRSNYTQSHGGKKQPFSEIFLSSSKRHVLFDTLQSEQDSRFYRKRNRNIAILNDGKDIDPLPAGFRWVSINALKQLTYIDHTVNTDLRSLISCLSAAGYYSEVEAAPDELQTMLCQARHSESGADDAAQALDFLDNCKSNNRHNSKLIALSDLKGWSIIDGKIRPHKGDGGFSVIGIKVHSNCREIDQWNQPIIDTHLNQHLWLFFQMRNRQPYFLTTAIKNSSLPGICEYSFTIETKKDNLREEPQWAAFFKSENTLTANLNVIQSEEGGRFFRDWNYYHLMELPDHMEIATLENQFWISYAGLFYLAGHGTVLTNELRSFLSFL